MVQAPSSVVDPVQFIGEAVGVPNTTEQLLRERITHIHAMGIGRVFVPATESITAVRDLIAADDLATLLLEGGLWQREEMPNQKRRRFDLGAGKQQALLESIDALKDASEEELPLVLVGRRNACAHQQMPPIMTKLVQESALWIEDTVVEMHPETASGAGLDEGDSAVVRIGSEERIVRVRLHTGIRPGTVQMSAGPSPIAIGSDYAAFGVEMLDLLEPDEHLGWNRSGVILRKA
jgi:anaerobic selenocysteine-containing dehydrogenase